MARSAKGLQEERGGAARVAVRRRDAWKDKLGDDRGSDRGSKSGKSPRSPGKAKKKGGGRAGQGPGALARAFKLVMLVGAFLCIGFFAVLVLDVTASLVGKVHLGEVTVVDLWHKMVDRVLDRDVPRSPAEPEKAAPKAIARPRTADRADRADKPERGERAPLPVAPRPEDDARHVAPERGDARPDPQVQRARQRLDEILGRL